MTLLLCGYTMTVVRVVGPRTEINWRYIIMYVPLSYAYGTRVTRQTAEGGARHDKKCCSAMCCAVFQRTPSELKKVSDEYSFKAF